jgi:hypothetical protein
VLLSALTETKTPEQLEEAWQAWVVDKATAPALSGKPALAAAFKDLLNEASIRAAYTPPTTPKFIAEHSVEHTIDTGGAQPVSAPFRRTPQLHVDFIRTTIQELLDAGVIRRSKSPWSAPVVVAAKPNGGLRFCVDYRELNKVTVNDPYPLPRVEDSLSALAGAAVFSTIDLRSGFHQIRVSESDIMKTAFRSVAGHYEYIGMPFGLRCAPATFQRAMEYILQEHLHVRTLPHLYRRRHHLQPRRRVSPRRRRRGASRPG